MKAWPFACALVACACLPSLPAHADPREAPPGATIAYEAPRAGRVSLAVYDRGGRLVRTLLTGKPHAAGKRSLFWDGLDRYGQPLPAGEYTWKALSTRGLRAEFITQVGQNPLPAWEKHVGNHANPKAAAIDPTGVYRLGGTNEGAHWGVKTDLEGRHVWTNDRWQADAWAGGGEALALLGGRAFELMNDGTVYGHDARTGRVFTGGDFAPKPWNFRWEGFQAKAGLKDDERRRQHARHGPGDLCADASAGLLVASYPRQDGLQWFGARDGKLVDTAKGIARPAGVAAAGGGTVLVISGGAVLALTRKDKKPMVFIPAGQLKAPWRLCVSPKTGDVFVAENSYLAGGDRHHQVKRFSKGGKFLRAYGRPQGRGDGAFVPTDFRGLTDIEADAEGGFLVVEGGHTPPRRVARFGADGKLLREWYGAQHYGMVVCPEPGNPRFVWALANAPRPGLVRYEVDYEKKTWRVAEVYQDVFARNPYATVPPIPTLFSHKGRVYIQGGGLQPGGLALCVYDPGKRALRPANASGTRGKRHYLWNDLNDDGLATDDEVQWLEGHRLGGHVRPSDLALLTTPNPTGFAPARLIAPARLTAGGTPVYSKALARPLPPWRENGMETFPSDYREAPGGGHFACFSDRVSNPHETHENHGAWYYNSCSAMDRLVKWDRDWKPVWSVGRHSPDDDHEAGSTAMGRGLVGLAHGFVIWADASDEETCRPTVWTEDGLYVDELLRVPADGLPKTLYGQDNTNEYPCGHIAVDPKAGRTYYYAVNSTGGSPIYRITGWKDVHRQQGSVRLARRATQVAKRGGTGLKAEYFNSADCSGTPALTRTDKLVYFNWGKNAPHPKVAAERFSVRWSGAYEAATNEDVRFEVRGNFPWRDPGKPAWAKLWLGGRLVLDTGKQGTGTARVRLRAGRKYDIKLECGFVRGKAAVALSTDTPGLDRRAVLPAFLYPEAGGEKAAALVVGREERPAVIAHFDFEKPEGKLVWSRAGGDVFGRLTGPARLVPGKAGQGVELRGEGPFAPALFPIDEELRLPDADYSVSFWFRTGDADVRLCEARRYSSYNNRLADHAVMLERGKAEFRLAGAAPLLSAGRYDDGKWHHLVTTVGAGGHRLYVDGRLVGAGKLERRRNRSSRLGLDVGPGGAKGTVAFDEVVVHGKALSAKEAEALAR